VPPLCKMNPDDEASSPPSQRGVLDRAAQLLKLLATAGKPGMPLTILSQSTGMANSTVHRLLDNMCAQGMVIQHESTRRYALGPLIFELGLAASPMFDPRKIASPILGKLAEEVGDTVYLTVRSGADAVCIDRQEGPSPVRVLTLDVGSRRPLGLGAGGLAILAFLPESERNGLIQRLARCEPHYAGHSVEPLTAAVAECRRNGYALIRNKVNPGVSAVGVPVLNSFDQSFAAISIAAIDARMPADRIAMLANILQRHARLIRHKLSEMVHLVSV